MVGTVPTCGCHCQMCPLLRPYLRFWCCWVVLGGVSSVPPSCLVLPVGGTRGHRVAGGGAHGLHWLLGTTSLTPTVPFTPAATADVKSQLPSPLQTQPGCPCKSANSSQGRLLRGSCSTDPIFEPLGFDNQLPRLVPHGGPSSSACRAVQIQGSLQAWLRPLGGSPLVGQLLPPPLLPPALPSRILLRPALCSFPSESVPRDPNVNKPRPL